MRAGRLFACVRAGANVTVYTLALQSVALSDEGAYRCQASMSNTHRPASSREAHITVLCTPLEPLNFAFILVLSLCLIIVAYYVGITSRAT